MKSDIFSLWKKMERTTTNCFTSKWALMLYHTLFPECWAIHLCKLWFYLLSSTVQHRPYLKPRTCRLRTRILSMSLTMVVCAASVSCSSLQTASSTEGWSSTLLLCLWPYKSSFILSSLSFVSGSQAFPTRPWLSSWMACLEWWSSSTTTLWAQFR